MTQDTRKDRRVKIVSLNVRYKSATVDEFIENHAHDVSRGGIYIKTANPFPAGTLLKFEIRLASDQAVIAGVGRVVWKRDAANGQNERPAGMGVKFIKIDPPSAAVIDKLVNTRSDAGKSFEAESEGSDAPPPVLQAPPPAAAAGAPAPAATASKPPVAAAVANMPVRKATMMGIGMTSPLSPSGAGSSAGVAPAPAAASAAGTGPTTHSTPPRPTPSHAPKPSAAAAAASAPLFPKADPEAEAPPPQEQTVMKQAAELLEEALREAGGSMEDVGTNPLFAGASAAKAADAPAAAPVNGGPLDEAAKARAMAGGLTAAPLPAEDKKASEPPPRTTRDTPTAKVSERPKAQSRPPSRPPSRPSFPRVSSPPPKKKSSGGTVAIIIGFAAIAAAVVMYKDKIFGAASEAQPQAATPAATASVAPGASAAPSAAASASASAAPAPEAPSASAAPSAATAAGSASSAPAPSASGASPSGSSSAAAAATKEAPAAAAAPAPKPAAAAPAPKPAAAAPAEAAAAPAPKPAPATKPAAAAPKPKPKADEDNPY